MLWLAGIVMAQSAPVPVDQEPHHHVMLRNQFVVVIHTTVQPGDSTLFHVHSHDNAGVDLTTRTTTEQLLGQPEGQPSTTRAGTIFAGSPNGGSMTHRVHNVGSGPMEAMFVDLLQRPAQPSTHVAAPVAAENASARVYNWALAPGAVSAMHSHERPYLIIAVTPMHLKMTGPDGRSLSEEVKPGDFHWIDAKVTHTLENTGSTPGQLIEIELK